MRTISVETYVLNLRIYLTRMANFAPSKCFLNSQGTIDPHHIAPSSEDSKGFCFLNNTREQPPDYPPLSSPRGRRDQTEIKSKLTETLTTLPHQSDSNSLTLFAQTANPNSP